MSYERVTLGGVGPGNDLKQSDQALSVPDYKNSYSDLVIDNLHCIAQCCWRIFFAEPELPGSAITGPSPALQTGRLKGCSALIPDEHASL